MDRQVNLELKEYVVKHIFPEYTKNDSGHQLSHIEYVIRRSFQFASSLNNINPNIVYTVAAYHDIGHHVDPKHHEIVSSKIFRNDTTIQAFFTDAGRRLISEAIEDHRSLQDRPPRSIYGKIITSADVMIDIDDMLRRTYAYRLRNYPDSSIEEIIADSRNHLIEKYGESGYARNKMYFDDPEFDNALTNLQNLIKDPEVFRKRYIEVNRLEDAIELDALLCDVNPHLRSYIKTNIFPQYSKNDRAHGLIHIREVMRRSFVLNQTFDLRLRPDLIYTIAAYHDVGKHIDSDHHEIISADIFLKDSYMSTFFSATDQKLIANAIEDHRSSRFDMPRSDYGKLISSADRNTRIEIVFIRSFFVGQDRQPNTTVADFLDFTFKRLTKRYSFDDPENMFYPDQEYYDFLQAMRQLLKDENKFKQKYCEVNHILSRRHTLAEETGVISKLLTSVGVSAT